MSAGRIRAVKVLVWIVCGWKGADLFYRAFWGDLGVNPVETLQLTSGETALVILLCSLAVTPVRRITGWNWLQSFRRLLGLWAFFYAVAHFLFYILFDQACVYWSDCQLAAVVDDVIKRKFILSGMVSLLAMVPLALTSTKGWIRRLGKRWQKLHRLAYVAGIAGAIHYIWKTKVPEPEPYTYAGVLLVLLGARVVFSIQKRRASTARAKG
jgi:sulfoxide reductase heme-binding subunit YedZ